MTRLYIAGPMRGRPGLNFLAFDMAARHLVDAGYQVFNPADHNRAHPGGTLRQYFHVDMAWICTQADGIALLPGWASSSGACAERALAEALDLPVDTVQHWLVAGAPHA